MNENTDRIYCPVALHWTSASGDTLTSKLIKEIQEQKEKSLRLSGELGQLKRRSKHLQTYVTSLATQIPRVVSADSFNATGLRTAYSYEAFAQLPMIQKSASFLLSSSCMPDVFPRVESWSTMGSVPGDTLSERSVSCESLTELKFDEALAKRPGHIRQKKIGIYKAKPKKSNAISSRGVDIRCEAAKKKSITSGKFTEVDLSPVPLNK